MRIPVSLSVLSALLVASAAHAQTPSPSGSDQPTPAPAPSATSGAAEPPAESAPPAQQLVEPPKAPEPSWFNRPNFEISAGKDDQKWKLQVYGFAEFDAMNDSTRSFNDSQSQGGIQRNETFRGQQGRTQFTARNSRLGVKATTPKFEGIKSTGVVEVDFMSNPGSFSTTGAELTSNATLSEASNYNNGVFRLRHAYVKIEDDIVDITAGQTYYVFGGIQSYFFPCAIEFLPIPNQVFGRTTQLRLSKTIDTDDKSKNSGVKLDIAIAAVRPPQRDSTVPEGQAALRLGFKGWQGIHTPGSGGTGADPLAIAVSGTVRRFKVDGFQPVPSDSSTDTGWGVAVDALIPVIPVKDSNDRGNALTLNGEFTTGSGYADQVGGLTGGVGQNTPAYPAPATGGTQALTNIDPGMVIYDPSKNGVLHTIDWQTYMIGVQYYLPPSGRFFISGNYTHGESKNLVDLLGGPANAKGVFKDSTYWNVNLFFDVTPAVRTAVSFNYTTQHAGDGEEVRNMRWFASAYYFF